MPKYSGEGHNVAKTGGTISHLECTANDTPVLDLTATATKETCKVIIKTMEITLAVPYIGYQGQQRLGHHLSLDA